jgi:hypothetical protein
MRFRRARPGGPTPAEPAPLSGPLAGVDRYAVAPRVLEQTLQAVREAGDGGDELFLAWGAELDGATARFTAAIAPAQRCLHTPEGLLVVIDDEALFELNQRFNEAGVILCGQAHAHPRRAYHSRADNELAIAPFPGSISLVVPDFARRPSRRGWRWYRRDADRRWERLDPELVDLR